MSELLICSACKSQISRKAKTCPHCGHPQASADKSNPRNWGIGGWLIAAFVIFLLYQCSTRQANIQTPDDATATATATTATAATPMYSAKVLSVTCNENYGRARADISIQNTGVEIPFAKAYVTFGSGEVADSYFSPHTVPAGSMSSSTVYARGAETKCQLSGIQDKNGNPVAIN